MNSPTTPQKMSKRRRWILGVLGAGVLAVLIAGFLVYRGLTNPQRVRAIAEEQLSRIIGGRCTIGEASFSLFGEVRLTNVSVSPAGGETVFTCRQVNAAHDAVTLLGGELHLTAVTAIEPRLKFLYDDATGQSNFAGLFSKTETTKSASGRWPTIELRNAVVSVGRRTDAGEHSLEDLHLTLRGRPTASDPSRYDVVWHDDGDDSSGHSQIDLSTGLLKNVNGGLPSMSIEAVMLAVASKYDAAAAWGDLLGITGKVRVTNYNLMGSNEAPRSATIRLDDASLSIPASEGERELPSDRRYLNFQHVRGNVVVTSAEVGAFFEAIIQGAECIVKATIRRSGEAWTTLRDLQAEGEIELKTLRVPRDDADAPGDERRFVQAWPQLTSFLRDYEPRGLMDLDIFLWKDAGEDQVQVRHAVVTPRGGEASARWFPYQGRNLRGSVTYSPGGVSISDICGDHDGGTVCVNGHFDKPDKCAPARLRIVGEKIPYDESLIGGLSERYRRMVEPFKLDVPLRAEVQLERGACENGVSADWTWSADIVFSHAALRHDRLSFPLENAGAMLHVTNERIERLALEAEIEGTPVSVDGSVYFFDEGRHHGIYTARLSGADLSSHLMTLLPAAAGDAINGLHPSGRLDAQLRMESEDEIGLTVQSGELQLLSVDVEPEAFPVAIRSLQGPVLFHSLGLKIGPLQGRQGRSAVTIAGDAKFGGESPEFDLSVKSPDLLFGETLQAALPTAIRESLLPLRIREPFEVEVNVRRHADRTKIDWDLAARLPGVTVDHEKLPEPLRNVRGTVTADPSGFRGQELLAEYAGAKLRADFAAPLGSDQSVAFDLDGVVLDENFRSAVPAAFLPLWDRLTPHGRLRIETGKLTHTRAPDGRAVWNIEAALRLNDLAFLGLGDLERIDGTVTAHGTIFDEDGGSDLQGEIHLDQLTYAGRTLTQVSSPWSYRRTPEGPSALSLQDVRGEVYGGMVGGQWTLAGDDRGSTYSASAMLYGMNLAPWIDAGRRRAPEVLEGSAEYKPSQVKGRVDLTLNLSGDAGDRASRRGAGRIEVREAQIYRLPFLLAILNVVNVTLPKEDFVHDAEARFFVTGDRIDLETVELQGGPLTLLGSGTVSLPDQAVDLRLYATSATALSHVPLIADIIEGTTKELVELRVTGPIARPTVRPAPFRGVSEEIKNLFQKKERKPIAPSGN